MTTLDITPLRPAAIVVDELEPTEKHSLRTKALFVTGATVVVLCTAAVAMAVMLTNPSFGGDITNSSFSGDINHKNNITADGLFDSDAKFPYPTQFGDPTYTAVGHGVCASLLCGEECNLVTLHQFCRDDGVNVGPCLKEMNESHHSLVECSNTCSLHPDCTGFRPHGIGDCTLYMSFEISGAVSASNNSATMANPADHVGHCYAKDFELQGSETMAKSAYKDDMMFAHIIYALVGPGGCLSDEGTLADNQHTFSYAYGGKEQCGQACNADPACVGFDTRSKGCHLYREIDVRASDSDTTGDKFRAVCYRLKGFTTEGGYEPISGAIFYKPVGFGYCIPDHAPVERADTPTVYDDDYYYSYYDGGNRYLSELQHSLITSTDRLAKRTVDGSSTESISPPYPSDDTVHPGIDKVSPFTCSVECNKKALRGW
jgi:hypothetical protein